MRLLLANFVVPSSCHVPKIDRAQPAAADHPNWVFGDKFDGCRMIAEIRAGRCQGRNYLFGGMYGQRSRKEFARASIDKADLLQSIQEAIGKIDEAIEEERGLAFANPDN
jgi:hypothetical protein